MTETTLTRTDTGSFAPVRVVDPEQPVSAPYSRAVGILEGWARDERHAVDEFAAWIEGQAAQAAAEMRALCDELELPVAWAEYDWDFQPASVKPTEPDPNDNIGLGMGPALRARYGTMGGPPRRVEDFGPAPDENMPGRVALPRRNDVFDRPFVPAPADYGPWVNLAEDDLMPGHAVRVGRSSGPAPQGPRGGFWRRIDGWLERADGWLRRKQAERDKRIGAVE